jgi:glutamate racemase
LTAASLNNAPIGVFDSGVGGLTVLAALRRRMPAANFLYLGDTARLPYGTKSSDTIVRYALQAATLLQQRGIAALVVACNTASSVALPALREKFSGLPVIGVVEPGAAAACLATRSGRVAVLATEGTVRGGAYLKAIHALRPDVQVSQLACQVLVALAEEGWHDNDVTLAAVRRYLQPLLAAAQPDTLVLGCTHFPLFSGVIARVCGADVRIVDSAQTTADMTALVLGRAASGGADAAGSLHFLATDGPERFARVGSRFLGEPLAPTAIELVDL